MKPNEEKKWLLYFIILLIPWLNIINPRMKHIRNQWSNHCRKQYHQVCNGRNPPPRSIRLWATITFKVIISLIICNIYFFFISTMYNRRCFLVWMSCWVHCLQILFKQHPGNLLIRYDPRQVWLCNFLSDIFNFQ